MSVKKAKGMILAELIAFAARFAGGVLHIYSGTQPASADDAEAGTLLGIITVDGLAHTPGEVTNGLNFGSPVDGVISPAEGEEWKGTWVATGEATWFRFYDKDEITDASDVAVRWDGSVGVADADLLLENVTVDMGQSIIVTLNVNNPPA
ncbi:hypothetical protein [Desulfotalea psychrophila]|uniref:Uncharacterized protein n=1 Tax=Desulfotalea psychrophila (strain LSv54 / DSM 12343) TaxID=177439 RepID=Q6ALP8_DESPS|nr:hypothetical protein [Desulfotalea psychrophila]CAG36727.1 unknown protein [Desulfotalea psychrophila LSv54]